MNLENIENELKFRIIDINVNVNMTTNEVDDKSPVTKFGLERKKQFLLKVKVFLLRRVHLKKNININQQNYLKVELMIINKVKIPIIKIKINLIVVLIIVIQKIV